MHKDPIVCAMVLLTDDVGWYVFRGDDILDHVLVDTPGFHEVAQADGYKEVPRHFCGTPT